MKTLKWVHIKPHLNSWWLCEESFPVNNSTRATGVKAKIVGKFYESGHPYFELSWFNRQGREVCLKQTVDDLKFAKQVLETKLRTLYGKILPEIEPSCSGKVKEL